MHCPLPNGHCAWSILPVGEANGPVGGSNGYWRQAALAVFWVQADIAVSGLLTRKAALSATLRAELLCESRAWLLPRSSMRCLRDQALAYECSLDQFRSASKIEAVLGHEGEL